MRASRKPEGLYPPGEQPDAKLVGMLKKGTPSRIQRGMAMDGGGGGMMGGGGGGIERLTIDGRTFDAARTDQRARLGAVEEWTVENPTAMDHPFHLHVWPFVVLDGGGAPVIPGGRKDTVNVPAGSAVRFRVAYTDFGGRTVYHCHILDHEDQGMMGVIDVR